MPPNHSPQHPKAAFWRAKHMLGVGEGRAALWGGGGRAWGREWGVNGAI